jgi:hypothetical protein
MIRAPQRFDGTWSDLYRDFIEPNLPSIASIRDCHEWMRHYVDDPSSVLPVRCIGSNERRRQTFTTNGDRKIIMADNAPAWALHAWLVTGLINCYDEFRASMAGIPCHMFDVRKSVGVTINDFGWYVAHLYPTKNRDIDWKAWSHTEVRRRFYLTIHPCNLFFVPLVDRQAGESPDVIGFVADRYSDRYGPIWDEFVDIIGGVVLTSPSGFGRRPVATLGTTQPHPDQANLRGPLPPHATTGLPAATYTATRLLFRKAVIEQLTPDQSFQVRTPIGNFQFTKQEFYESFPNVVQSRSYQVGGIYHYPALPKRAERFRVG